MRNEYPAGFDDLVRAAYLYEGGVLYELSGEKRKPVWKQHATGAFITTLVIGKKPYVMLAGRVVYFLHKGVWPTRLKYKDGNCANHKWENIDDTQEEIVMEKRPVGRPPGSTSANTESSIKRKKEKERDPRYGEPGRDYYREQMEWNAVVRERELKYREAVMACHPIFNEWITWELEAEATYRKERWKEGLLTGGDRYDAVLFFEAANQELAPTLTYEEAFHKWREIRAAGGLGDIDKVEADRYYAGYLLHAERLNIISHDQLQVFLREYTYKGKTFSSTFPEKKAAYLARLLDKHGVKSLAHAEAIAVATLNKRYLEALSKTIDDAPTALQEAMERCEENRES